MKNIRITVVMMTLIVVFSQFGFSQTGSYSCNVINGDDINQPLLGVQVDLYDSNDDYVGTSYTGEDGFFTFDNLIIGNSYTAKFTYDAEVTSVDLADAYLLLEYLSGETELTEIQLLAADVDGNESVDIDDFWSIVDDYYINEIPFPVGPWVSEDWTFVMEAGKMMGGPAKVTESGGIIDIDDNKNNTSIEINYNDLQSFDNSEITIPIYIDESITVKGAGLVLGFNNELINIVSVESPIDNMKYSVKNGVIRIGWTDINTSYEFNPEKALVNISIEQKKAAYDGQIEEFKLLDETHLLDKSGRRYHFISFKSSRFKLKNNITTTALAYPNPCNNYFTINSLAGEDGSKCVIQFYNNLGQLVHSNVAYIRNQSLTIHTEQLNSGLYIYHINNLSESKSGTITILK